MKVWSSILLLALCAGGVGCTRVQEAAMPVVAKVNAAHPVSPEVRVAQEQLLMLLSDDPKAVDALKAQMESRLALRAMNCARNVSVGRLASVSAVRELPMEATCFQQQDAELQEFYGIRTIGVLLAKPALRPLKAAGPLSTLATGKLAYISSGALARDAGVGVMLDGRGNGAVVEMPGGAPIAQLPNIGYLSAFNVRVSPNGRVVVLQAHDRAPEFVEAETGHHIWSVPGTGAHAARLLAWLPEVDSFAIAGVDGKVMLADGVLGRMEVHPLSLKNSSVAANIPGPTVHLLMGTSHELVLVEHTRTAQGVVASAIRQYRIESGPGITSGNPVPMRSGHLVVFRSSGDIGWLDLDGGTSGAWRTSGLFANDFAKLDESHLMIDSAQSGQMGLKPWSFDIAAESVAPVDLGGDRGLIIDIGDRIGFLRRSSFAAWFGDTVTPGEQQSLDKVMAEHELQQQLAKLQIQAGSNGEPALDARRLTSSVSAGAGAGTLPGLDDIPADAQVQMVGVYEAGHHATGLPTDHPLYSVRVEVRPSTHPLVLVLASYEAVNWVVVNSGARISAVLLSGQYDSRLNGAGSARVLRIGTAYAYSGGSAEYVRLRQAVMQYTGNREIRSFQGSYSGAEFLVGGT